MDDEMEEHAGFRSIIHWRHTLGLGVKSCNEGIFDYHSEYQLRELSLSEKHCKSLDHDEVKKGIFVSHPSHALPLLALPIA